VRNGIFFTPVRAPDGTFTMGRYACET
jgi:hypothetical protein